MNGRITDIVYHIYHRLIGYEIQCTEKVNQGSQAGRAASKATTCKLPVSRSHVTT